MAQIVWRNDSSSPVTWVLATPESYETGSLPPGEQKTRPVGGALGFQFSGTAACAFVLPAQAGDGPRSSRRTLLPLVPMCLGI
jgi:hypothetical protein